MLDSPYLNILYWNNYIRPIPHSINIYRLLLYITNRAYPIMWSIFEVFLSGINNIFFMLPLNKFFYIFCRMEDGRNSLKATNVDELRNVLDASNSYVRCHTPIFDLRYHWHVSFDPMFMRILTWSISDVSVENSAEGYFKIPHFGSESSPLLFLFIYLFVKSLISIFLFVF